MIMVHQISENYHLLQNNSCLGNRFPMGFLEGIQGRGKRRWKKRHIFLVFYDYLFISYGKFRRDPGDGGNNDGRNVDGKKDIFL